MPRRPRSRRLLTAAATVAAVTAAVPFTLSAAHAAPATPTEITVPATPSTQPPDTWVHFAGPTGFLYQTQGRAGEQWTDYADGTTTAVTSGTGDAPAGTDGPGAGSDVLVRVVSSTPLVYGFQDMATGRSTTVPAVSGWGPYGLHGTRILHRAGDGLSVSTVGFDGRVTERAVTGWPDGVPVGSAAVAWDADSEVLAFTGGDGARHLALVDLAQAAVTVLPGTLPSRASVLLGARYVGWYAVDARQSLTLVDRSTGAATVVQLPAEQGTIARTQLVGDWVVTSRFLPGQPSAASVWAGTLTATPVGGGATVTLSKYTDPTGTAQGPDSVVAAGGTSAADWAVRRWVQGDDGTLTARNTVPVAPLPVTVNGLTLDAGQLLTDEAAPVYGTYAYRRRITPGDGPGYGDRTPVFAKPDANPMFGLGDGGYAQVGTGSPATITVPVTTNSFQTVTPGAGTGHLVAANRAYLVFDGDSNGKQYVVPVVNDGKPVLTRSTTPAATLWGDTLWTAGTGGRLTAVSLPDQKALRTVTTGATCTPDELQAAGQWLYWACGTTAAGVVDLTTGKAVKGVAAAGGRALLGDGYLVRHDLDRGELTISTLTGDTATAPADLAALPAAAQGTTDDRRTTWSVDPYGGGIAYRDGLQRIHVVDPHVTPSPLTVASSTPFDSANPVGRTDWHGRWIISRPVASAKVTVTNAVGQVLRTLDATVTGASVTASWDGTLADGSRAFSAETDHWTLTVTAAGGGTATRSGGLAVYGGREPLRASPDGLAGNVLTVNSGGYLTAHYAGEPGGFTDKTGSSGWGTKILPVAFGDLDGDLGDDTLVRTSSGQLRAYHTIANGIAPKPSDPYTSLGTGFNTYKQLFCTGDVTGDGRPDLLAYDTAAAGLYLLPGTASGKLGARALIRSGQHYVRFIGVGDVDGDGIGDLMAYDHEHNLWLMTGDGKGSFRPRTLVFSDWGASYNAMVGVGDLTGDGRPDLLERDPAGKLWLNKGEAGGEFGSRQADGTGWQAYLGLY